MGINGLECLVTNRENARLYQPRKQGPVYIIPTAQAEDRLRMELVLTFPGLLMVLMFLESPVLGIMIILVFLLRSDHYFAWRQKDRNWALYEGDDVQPRIASRKTNKTYYFPIGMHGEYYAKPNLFASSPLYRISTREAREALEKTVIRIQIVSMAVLAVCIIACSVWVADVILQNHAQGERAVAFAPRNAPFLVMALWLYGQIIFLKHYISRICTGRGYPRVEPDDAVYLP